MLLTLTDLVIISGLLTLGLVWFLWKKSSFPKQEKQEEQAEVLSKRLEHVMDLLEKDEFSFVALKPQIKISMKVEQKEQDLVIDRKTLIVHKNNKYYAVKLKTGEMSGRRVTTASLRQQVLELQLGAQVDGVLLYDLEKNRYQLISFPLEKAKRNLAFYLLISLVTGFLICYILVLGGLIG